MEYYTIEDKKNFIYSIISVIFMILALANGFQGVNDSAFIHIMKIIIPMFISKLFLSFAGNNLMIIEDIVVALRKRNKTSNYDIYDDFYKINNRIIYLYCITANMFISAVPTMFIAIKRFDLYRMKDFNDFIYKLSYLILYSALYVLIWKNIFNKLSKVTDKFYG